MSLFIRVLILLRFFYSYHKKVKSGPTRKHVSIKDELDHFSFEEKFAKIIQIFLSKRSDPDQAHLFRIRNGQKSPDPTGTVSTTLQH
jgi:hypothetical protein